MHKPFAVARVLLQLHWNLCYFLVMWWVQFSHCWIRLITAQAHNQGRVRGVRRPPLIRQKGSKKGPIQLGWRSTIHKNDPPFKNPGYWPAALPNFGVFLSFPPRKNKLTCRPKSAPLENSTARSVVIIHKITVRIRNKQTLNHSEGTF